MVSEVPYSGFLLWVHQKEFIHWVHVQWLGTFDVMWLVRYLKNSPLPWCHWRQRRLDMHIRHLRADCSWRLAKLSSWSCTTDPTYGTHGLYVPRGTNFLLECVSRIWLSVISFNRLRLTPPIQSIQQFRRSVNKWTFGHDSWRVECKIVIGHMQRMLVQNSLYNRAF